MSLKEERDLEHFESLMYLEEKGTVNDPVPYQVMRQRWKIDREILEDNKSAVLGVRNSSKTKLGRKPDCRSVYERQLLDLLDKGFTREVSEAELEKWIKNSGKTYYIAHQVA